MINKQTLGKISERRRVGYTFSKKHTIGRYLETKEKNYSSHMYASEFIGLILDAYYFDEINEAEKVFPVIEEYFATYDYKKDPYYKKYSNIKNKKWVGKYWMIVKWWEYFYLLVIKKLDKKEILEEYSNYYFDSYLLDETGKISYQKNEADIFENSMFMKWLAGTDIKIFDAEIRKCNRTLLNEMVLIINGKKDLSDFVKQFNRNKHNITHSLQHGYPELIFHFRFAGKKLNPETLVKYSIEGITD